MVLGGNEMGAGQPPVKGRLKEIERAMEARKRGEPTDAQIQEQEEAAHRAEQGKVKTEALETFKDLIPRIREAYVRAIAQDRVMATEADRQAEIARAPSEQRAWGDINWNSDSDYVFRAMLDQVVIEQGADWRIAHNAEQRDDRSKRQGAAVLLDERYILGEKSKAVVDGTRAMMSKLLQVGGGINQRAVEMKISEEASEHEQAKGLN